MMMVLKLLTLLLQPLGTAALLLLVALSLWRRRRLALGLVACALAWLWLWATPWASTALCASLERRYAALPAERLPHADAILLLGGGIEPASPPLRNDFDLTAAGDRIVHAAALYRAGKAPVIVATGGRLPWTAGAASEADAMAQALARLGVPDTAILREDRARTTRENMRYSAPKLAQLHARRVLLVTSALHMPRAMANARVLGVEAIAAPTDVEVLPERRYGLLGVLPDAQKLERSSAAFKEYLGLAYDAVFGVR
ncbi:YdcF family protein [Fontimonas sp. SYSU GA230001]|uniref:YdcF family protein n=1 Tax=Fontimonas sp. SYSU GA230001 TaxID=3142450 RepID=UPI0032B469D5